MTTLASGVTLQSKYGKLGGFTGHMIAPPGRINAFICGLPGTGKSAFLQSHPGAFIFNLDNSSTVTPTPNAAMWPGRDEKTGRPINDDGTPLILTWPMVQAKIALLKELAAANAPRPETIVFDSITSWVQLLFNWIPPNAVSLYLRSGEKPPTDSWRALDGMSAWTTLYDIIIETITSLANCGYGVYVIGHVVQTTIPIAGDSEGLTMPKFDLTMGPGLWRRIFPVFELSACITSSMKTREVDRVRRIPRRDGTFTEMTTKVAESFQAYQITYELPGMEGISKARVRFPSVILPEENGWAAFEKVYLETRAQRLSPSAPTA